MNINDLLVNDEFCQCIRKTKRLPDDEIKERENKIRECNHLFVLISDHVSSSEFVMKDKKFQCEKYECVHCGLTNKFKKLEDSFFAYYPFGYEFLDKTIETRLFEEYLLKSIKNKTSINLISNESLPTYHPGLLYSLALMINKNGSNEELFEIMANLHDLETENERLRLSNIYQAKALLERYSLYMPKAQYDDIKKYSLNMNHETK